MPGTRTVDQIRDGLNQTISALEETIHEFRTEWAAGKYTHDLNPLKARTSDGQLILAPLYVGLANAYAALLALPPESSERQVRL